MATAHAPRTRRSFARLNKVLEVPNLIDIQRKSFEWLTDAENGGLRETIDDISPIEDYTGNLAVQFGEFSFDQPVASLEQCREKDLTYARPLTVTVAFINRETGEIREQSVFMGDFPWMTERGTFIINGTERVVVTQLVRSPGAYVMAPKDPEKQVFIANLMPARGSWLELEVDKKGKVFVRIDRKRKLPVTVLLRAMGYVEDQKLLDMFDNSIYLRHTIEADSEATRTEEGALVELAAGSQLDKIAFQGADGIEIGAHLGEVGLLLRGEFDWALRCGLTCPAQSQYKTKCAKQKSGAAEGFAGHVTRLSPSPLDRISAVRE